MARIKIKDLPADQKISNEELKKVLGGAYLSTSLKTISPFDLGTFSPVIAGCGCTGMAQDPKEAGC